MSHVIPDTIPIFLTKLCSFFFVPGRSEPGLPAQSHPGTGRRARRGPAAFHSEYKREALAQQMLDYLAQVLRHVVRRTPVDPPMCLVLSHQRRGLSWGLLASVASVPGGGGVRGSARAKAPSGDGSREVYEVARVGFTWGGGGVVCR